MRPVTRWRALAIPRIALMILGVAASSCSNTVTKTDEPKAAIPTTTRVSPPKSLRKSKTTAHASTATTTSTSTTTDSARASGSIMSSSRDSTPDSPSGSTATGNTATPDSAVAELPTKSNLPNEAKSRWQVGQGEVHVICPLTVGGSFDAKTTSLTASVVPAASRHPSYMGSFSVDLRTLDTGIDLRNEHLRNSYLEVAKGDGFEKAVFSDISLGEVDPETFQGQTSFTGTFLLHGVKRTITGRAEIHRSPTSVRVEANFPVTLADYGIAKPQYLGIGVKNQVQVKVAFAARPVITSARVSQ